MSFHARSAEGPPTFWHPGKCGGPQLSPLVDNGIGFVFQPVCPVTSYLSSRDLRIYVDSNLALFGARTSRPAYPSLPQDGDKCEGPVKIGFVSLPGNSRRTDASYFFITSYIVEILASF